VNCPSIRELDTGGRKVFLRADLNVPLESGRIADDTRIMAVLPTLRKLLESGSPVILASHLGRPKGEAVPSLSLKPVAEKIAGITGMNVLLAPGCTGPVVRGMADGLGLGDVLVLENLRFDPRETGCDGGFARELASLADVYVNDAFGTCHRKHASMYGVPLELGGGYAGFLVERELEVFGKIVSAPERPFTVLLGGAKVSDKLPVIRNLLDKVDNLLIGGGMAFTFLRAMGREIGKSIVEDDILYTASRLIEEARNMGVNMVLPYDIVVAHSHAEGAYARNVSIDSIPPDQAGLDIGSETAEAFAGVIRQSGTVLWNGPMGLFEVPPFDNSTRIIAATLAEATMKGVTTVVGGGDTVRAVAESGVVNRLSWVSTGGGASLMLLEGKELPAIAALRNVRV
jgi:phosphoglycerate kinase